jgi:hypothetical protein
LKKSVSDAELKDSEGSSGKKPGLLNFGRRIESEPDPDLPATQDSGRTGDIVPSAAKEAEDSKAERQMRRREKREEWGNKGKRRKIQTGARSQNGRPPDLVVYNPK